MENRLSLEAEVREHTGTRHAAAVREQARIPAVVYGHKQSPVAVSLNEHDFVEGLHHGHRLMDITINGKTEQVMVKDLQYDHLGRNIIHADLVRVDLSETVQISVGIELKGTAPGTEEGGIIEAPHDSIEVECKVTDIPDTIVVSVKEMNIGDSIHAGDLELPPGVTLISAEDMLIATCHVVTEAEAAEEEEEGPEAPEVIGEAERAEEAEEEQQQESGE